MSTAAKVFVCRRIPDVGIDLLRRSCMVDVWEDELPPSRSQLLERARGCDGVLSLLSDRIDGELMDAIGSQLKVISNFAVGYDNLDIAAAKYRRIAVGNTPGALTDATADTAVALTLAAARRLPEAIDQVRRHEWRTWAPLGLLGHELAGATLGIIGMGRIGMAVARRLQGGWGMSVLYSSRQIKPEVDSMFNAHRVELSELLQQSDIVSIHCDLNGSTRHLINASALASMKPNAILINTSRGGVIDQTALADALRAGRPWAAALDVTDPEPLPAGHPLWSLPNCLIVPHIGSATFKARNEMATIAAKNMLAGLLGNPLPHQVEYSSEQGTSE